MKTDGSPPEQDPGELVGLLLHTLLGVGCFLLLLLGLSLLLRQELEGLGRIFVARLGLCGMAAGTFLADGLSLPVPPQLYLLTARLSKADPAPALAVISAASVAAGHFGYQIARLLQRRPLFARLLLRSRGRAEVLLQRHGPWVIFAGSVAPIPYSLLCYTAGLYRMSYPLFCAFTLLRVPRLLLYYLLIKLGWG